MCAAEVSTLSLPFQTPLVAIFIMVKIVILKHYLKKKKTLYDKTICSISGSICIDYSYS